MLEPHLNKKEELKAISWFNWILLSLVVHPLPPPPPISSIRQFYKNCNWQLAQKQNQRVK
jgi:hypothetical protein